MSNIQNNNNFYTEIKTLLENTRNKVYQTINTTMTLRKFYLVFSKSETASRKLKLNWSHYIFLTRIAHEDERGFYEIQVIQNSWTLRELKKQFKLGCPNGSPVYNYLTFKEIQK